MVRPALPAQAPPTSHLEFLGFRPGLSRAQAEARLAALGGGWRCTASAVDPRIAECRGSLRIEGGPTLSVTGSLVSGGTAILLLAGPTDAEQLTRWHQELAGRYGDVPVRTEHSQQSWQWTRQRRMIRLTSRVEDGERVASVSLVDGPLLDNLGASPPPIQGPSP